MRKLKKKIKKLMILITTVKKSVINIKKKLKSKLKLSLEKKKITFPKLKIMKKLIK